MSKSFEKVQKAIVAPLNEFSCVEVGWEWAKLPLLLCGSSLIPFLKKGENAEFIEKIGESGVKIAKKLRLSFPEPLLSWKK